MASQALVDLIRDYARKHYEDSSWDVIFDAYTDEEIAFELDEARCFTEEDAIDYFKRWVKDWTANHRIYRP